MRLTAGPLGAGVASSDACGPCDCHCLLTRDVWRLALSHADAPKGEMWGNGLAVAQALPTLENRYEVISHGALVA